MRWQNGLGWAEQFELLGADGIDFHDLFVTPPHCTINASFTKEEFLKGVAYPKSNYTFWKSVNGHKCYLNMTDQEVNKKPLHRIAVIENLDYVTGHLRYGHREGFLDLTDEEFAKFKQNPKEYVENCDEDFELIVDDWRVEDYGNISDVEWHEEERH